METNLLLRFKTAMKGDAVIPKLHISASVLFARGSVNLAKGAADKLDNVAKFVQNFTPSRLVITAGHHWSSKVTRTPTGMRPQINHCRRLVPTQSENLYSNSIPRCSSPVSYTHLTLPTKA